MSQPRAAFCIWLWPLPYSFEGYYGDRMKPGESLQRIVEALERAIHVTSSVRVESPKFLPDRDTGEPREHDVVLTFTIGHHTMRIAMECRDRSRKVGVPEIEAFKHKCSRTGIDKGIVVSSKGFWDTAMKKAEALDVGCLTLEEAEQFDWCRAPGLELIEREFCQGTHVHIEASEAIRDGTEFYDASGSIVNNIGLRNLVSACLDARPPEIAASEDRRALQEVVRNAYINDGASAFYAFNHAGHKIPLTRMTIDVVYTARSKLILFDFRNYIDASLGRELHNVAIAPVDLPDWQGDLILHRMDDGRIQVSAISRPLPRKF